MIILLGELCVMRTFTIILLAALGVLALVAAEKVTDAWPPRVTLPEALRLAEEHVRTNKIDTSQQYLSAIRIQTDKNGSHYWEASWMHTNQMVRGGFFMVRVHMDRTVTFIGGK
jgi:hypothetical protein